MKNNVLAVKDANFKGIYESIENYVYLVSGSKGGLQFIKTTEELAAYGRAEYKHTGPYVSRTIQELAEVLPERSNILDEMEKLTGVDAKNQDIMKTYTEELKIHKEDMEE